MNRFSGLERASRRVASMSAITLAPLASAVGVIATRYRVAPISAVALALLAVGVRTAPTGTQVTDEAAAHSDGLPSTGTIAARASIQPCL